MSRRDPGVTLRQILVHARRLQELTASLQAQHPEIPWKQIAGTRDRLSHGYDETDYAILWDAARNDLEPLIAAVEQMLDASSRG